MKRNEFFRKAAVLTGMAAMLIGTGVQALAQEHGRGRYERYDRGHEYREEHREYRYSRPYVAPYVRPYYAAPAAPYYYEDRDSDYQWRLEQERREWLRHHRDLYGYRPGFSIYIGR